MYNANNISTQLRRRPRFGLQRRLLNGAFATAARIADFTVDRRARRANIDVFRNVPYGRHRIAHRLDVFRPRDVARPLPVLLYIHGGAFTLCSKDTHRSLALANAEGAGYLVFNINYRLAPAYLFPAAIADACDAYRWVVENCARYGGDPERIVVAGESAGGNLALGVTIASTYKRPERYARNVYQAGLAPIGVMPITPYLQASDPARHAQYGYLTARVARSIAEIYLGAEARSSSKTYMADPIRVLEECGAPERDFPPVFSGVGTGDPCCWNDVRRLEQACDAHGIDAVVHYYPSEVHAFHVLRWRAASRKFWRRAFGFMKRLAVGDPRPLRPASVH